MERDERYYAVHVLITNREIQSFAGVFKYVPKTVIAKFLGTNNNRMTRLVNHPEGFSLAEIIRLADYFMVSPLEMTELILRD